MEVQQQKHKVKPIKCEKSTFRLAWSWSVDQWDWRPDISDPAPGNRTHEDLQGP